MDKYNTPEQLYRASNVIILFMLFDGSDSLIQQFSEKENVGRNGNFQFI